MPTPLEPEAIKAEILKRLRVYHSGESLGTRFDSTVNIAKHLADELFLDLANEDTRRTFGVAASDAFVASFFGPITIHGERLFETKVTAAKLLAPALSIYFQKLHEVVPCSAP